MIKVRKRDNDNPGRNKDGNMSGPPFGQTVRRTLYPIIPNKYNNKYIQ